MFKTCSRVEARLAEPLSDLENQYTHWTKKKITSIKKTFYFTNGINLQKRKCLEIHSGGGSIKKNVEPWPSELYNSPAPN